MNLSEEESQNLQNKLCINSYRSGFKKFNGYEMPIVFEKFIDQIYNLEVYDDDIWLITFPKSGTTWTQELIWCMCSNMDLEKAKINIDIRFPHIEFSGLFELKNLPNSVEEVQKLKRPRFIKTHLPWELLPKQISKFERRPKIINVRRRVEDVCVSYYHHAVERDFYCGSLEEYCLLFLNNKITYTPYFKHLISIWNHRNEPNILILKYEDMKIDCLTELHKLANFLGCELTEKDAMVLLKYTSFDQMKNNPAVQHKGRVKYFNDPLYKPVQFFRKGVVGSYKEELGEDIIKEFKMWTEECLKGINIDY